MSAYDPGTGLYYCFFQDFSGTMFLVTFDVKAKAIVSQARVLYVPYNFVLKPSESRSASSSLTL
jgi:hypothetical protein